MVRARFASGYAALTRPTDCGGRLQIIAAIEDPQLIVKILTHLGLPACALPRALARPLPLFQTA